MSGEYNAACALFNTSSKTPGEVAVGIFNNHGVSATSLTDALKQLSNTTALNACKLLQDCGKLLSLTCSDEAVGCSGLTSDQTSQFEDKLCQGFIASPTPGAKAAIIIFSVLFALLSITSIYFMASSNYDSSQVRQGVKNR